MGRLLENTARSRSHWTGALVLLLSLPLVYGWIYWFFLAATEIPVNGIGFSSLCNWQYDLSNALTWNGYSPLPFLGWMGIELALFIYRLFKGGKIWAMLLEFGQANLLFVGIGIVLFILLCVLYYALAMIPGSLDWLSHALRWEIVGNPGMYGCKPVFPAVPAIVTSTILCLGWFVCLATGCLVKKSKVPAG